MWMIAILTIIQNCQKENTAKKVFLFWGVGNFAIWRRKEKLIIKKTLTKLPTKQSPYFFPQTAGAYVWTLEDESGPFFFRASPSSSPLLQTVEALLSLCLSLSLSLSLSPPISFCLLLPKIAVILQYVENRSSFMSTAASSGNKTCLWFCFLSVLLCWENGVLWEFSFFLCTVLV